MSVADLPAVNATLNSTCALLLLAGWWFIKHERKTQHVVCMASALVVSTAFLACYVFYHYHVGSVKFTAQGIVRPVYFFILITHVILAFAIVPLVLMTIIPALRARFDRHRKWARITLPIWLYVSITGVIVYFMLYVWFPSAQLAG